MGRVGKGVGPLGDYDGCKMGGGGSGKGASRVLQGGSSLNSVG